MRLFPFLGLEKKIKARCCQVISWDIQLFLFPCPGSDEAGIIILHDFLEGNILPDAGVGPDLYAHFNNIVHFTIRDIFGQTVIRNADSRHSSRDGQGLKDRCLMTEEGQKISRRHPRRTGSDDSYLLSCLCPAFGPFDQLSFGQIKGRPFQCPDRYSFII